MAVQLASRHEVGAASVATTAEVGSIDFLIGTFTNKDSKGIYASSLDLATGSLAPATLVAEALQPSWLRFHPAQQTVYSVNEDGDAPSCTAYRLLRDGGGGGVLSLEKINTVSTGSAGPTHFSVSPSGKHLAVANYGGGALTVLPAAADGSLEAASALVQHEGSGPNEKRQSAPHAHSANFDRTGRFIFVCDLGTDELVVYELLPSGEVRRRSEARANPGGGPRHLAVHPSQDVVYMNDELGGTIYVYDFSARTATLTQRQTVPTLPSSYEGRNGTSEILLDAGGTRLYCANRGCAARQRHHCRRSIGCRRVFLLFGSEALGLLKWRSCAQARQHRRLRRAAERRAVRPEGSRADWEASTQLQLGPDGEVSALRQRARLDDHCLLRLPRERRA